MSDLPALARDPARWGQLRAAVRAGTFHAVIPYGLGPALRDDVGRAEVAAWFGALRAAGARVLLPIAGLDRIEAVRALIHAHPGARPDGLISEFEFWNRTARGAAFAELLELLAAMRALALVGGPPMTVGAYLGYPTAAEAAVLTHRVDLVLLDYPVRAPAAAWAHVHGRGGPLRDRFRWFSADGVAVWPIFYARGEVDMRAALARDGLAAAEARFAADVASDPALAGTRTAGFAYFTFEALPPPAPAP